MRFTRLAICALLLAPAPTFAQNAAPAAAAQQVQPLADLSGLWHAKKRVEQCRSRTGEADKESR